MTQVAVAASATLLVPDDYPTIQAAVTAAAPADLVLVAPGTYTENVDFAGKAIVLKSISGASVTTIDGGKSGTVVTMQDGGTLDGFTIRNGHAIGGGGVLIIGGTSALIRNNIIEDNTAGFSLDEGRGGGILAFHTPGVVIESNVIRRNQSLGSGGGVSIDALPGSSIRNNRIEGNAAYVTGGGAEVLDADVVDNIIASNYAYNFGAGLNISGGNLRVECNTVVDNFNDNDIAHASGILAGNVASDVRIARNLVIRNTGRGGSGIGLAAIAGRIECNDVWGNNNNLVLSAACDSTAGKNISVDPLLCPSAGDFLISQLSPCAPEQSNGCGLIGAGAVGCGVTTTRRDTWGSVKRRYR